MPEVDPERAALEAWRAERKAKALADGTFVDVAPKPAPVEAPAAEPVPVPEPSPEAVEEEVRSTRRRRRRAHDGPPAEGVPADALALDEQPAEEA